MIYNILLYFLKHYFVGSMDMTLWEDDCVFADPLSSFGGKGSTDRFRRNAANLGKFLKNPTLKVTSFSVRGNEITVSWIFNSVLALPWNPVLAASGQTRHIVNLKTNRIEKYEESWKTKPIEVIKRLFIPT